MSAEPRRGADPDRRRHRRERRARVPRGGAARRRGAPRRARDPQRRAGRRRSAQHPAAGPDRGPRAPARRPRRPGQRPGSGRDALQDLGPVDALLNNAGVVGSRDERATAQGLELQVGTNHLGHFAFTGLVLPMLERTGGRVVHLGSIAHRWATLDRRDPLGAGHYSGYRQYGRSKLAVMLFGFELAERLADAGSAVSSVVAHPGLALDSLGPSRPLVTPARDEPAWTRPGERLVRPGQGRRRAAARARRGRCRSPLGRVLGSRRCLPTAWTGCRRPRRAAGARPHPGSAALAGQRAGIRGRVRSRRIRLTPNRNRMSARVRRLVGDDHHL